jgi:hypothetical protein
MEAGSVGLALPMRGEDGSTFDFLLRLEAGLQHLEFLCERAKLSNHTGGPLPAQRLVASDGIDLRTMRWRRRLYAVFRLSAI